MATKKTDVTVVNPGGEPVAGPPKAAIPKAPWPPAGGVVGAVASPPHAPGPVNNPFAVIAPTTAQPVVAEMTGPVMATGFEMLPFLKGSDIPADVSQLPVEVVRFVRVTGARSPLVCEITEVYGKKYLPLNKTNINQLAAFIGQDLAAIVGHKIVLVVYPVNNPQSGVMTRGLYVGGVAE